MPSRTLLKTAALGLMSTLLLATLARRRARRGEARAGQGKTWPRTLADGPSMHLAGMETGDEGAADGAAEGAAEGGQAASARAAAQALRAAEIPEAGFPADGDDDAERIHPGLPDFARGA